MCLVVVASGSVMVQVTPAIPCWHNASESIMPTLTIRNFSPAVVNSLKSLARKHRRSMEQEVRELLAEHMAERNSVLEQIEAAWSRQNRRPTPKQVDKWIRAGRL